jgi:hypothetical protein
LWASNTDGEEPNGREIVGFMFYLLYLSRAPDLMSS